MYYLIGAGLDEDSLPEPINSRINSFSSERGTPLLLISSDSFTETDDEGNDDSLFSAKRSTSPEKKKKLRKPGFIRNLLFSKTNLLEEKGPQGKCLYYCIPMTLVHILRP
jgi:hypothetical protein